MGHLHVHQNLGVDGAAADKGTCFLPGPGQHLQELEGRHFTIAGGLHIGEDGVAGLLPADAVVPLQHLLQHVPVAHIRAEQVDAVVPAELVEAQVAHHRGHQGVAVELSPALHVQGAHRQDLVAVDDAAGLVHQQAAVRVPVKGHADVIAAPHHGGGQVLQVGGAAVAVDVHPVRVPVDEVRPGLEAAEQLRRGGAGSAVGAVRQDFQPRQIGLDGGGHEVDIVPLQLAHTVVAAADLPPGSELHGLLGEDLLLDPGLHAVGELVALSAEDLDAVVLIGVVTGGDHDARVRLFLHGEIGHRRGGNGAHRLYVAAHGAEPRHQGGLQHVGGDAGVLADHHGGAAALVLHQNSAHGLPHAEGHVGSEVLPHHAADAVGSK